MKKAVIIKKGLKLLLLSSDQNGKSGTVYRI